MIQSATDVVFLEINKLKDALQKVEYKHDDF